MDMEEAEGGLAMPEASTKRTLQISMRRHVNSKSGLTLSSNTLK